MIGQGKRSHAEGRTEMTKIASKRSVLATRAGVACLLAVAFLVMGYFQQSRVQAQANSPPVFAAASATREIEENTNAGIHVGLPVTATDADGDAITYAIRGTAFSIDSAAGQIRVATGAVLDYETTPSYSVTVLAVDSQNGTDTIAVTINVLDVREDGLLSRIVIEVGSSGTTYGFDAGSYGTLFTGDYPGALFNDDQDRDVEAITEDADGYWYFEYTGGTGGDWNTDQEHLDNIHVAVTYESEMDGRDFVIGGFIVERNGNVLKIAPPLPNTRDWDDKDAEQIAFDFRHPRTEPADPTLPPKIEDPVGLPGSPVEWIVNNTPGGRVMTQSMIVLLVYFLYMSRAPATAWGLWIGVGALVGTAWVTVFLGFGSIMGASMALLNIISGAFLYKGWIARTES